MEKKLLRSDSNSDRISELPEPIRRHILSFLETKFAVRTGILSSSWRALWVDLPNLKLGRNQVEKLITEMSFYNDDDDDGNDDAVVSDLVVKKMEGFYGFLDRVLVSNCRLKKLDLCVPGYSDALKPRLDYWLECAVGRGVEELMLEIPWNSRLKYSLPKSVLGVRSVTKLKLQRCEIYLSSLVGNGLPSLRELSLECVGLDDGVMESLSTCCPNLEDLIFKCCDRVTRFVVSGLIKLTKIDVEISQEDIETIEVEAPNLLEFTYMNEWNMDGEICEIEMLDCKNLRRLMLYGAQLSDYEFNPLLEGLPLLEELELCQCNRLKHICISNPHLVQLKVSLCMLLLKAEIRTPSLKNLRYSDNDLMFFVPKGSALKLAEADIYLEFTFGGRKWHDTLVKCLAKLCHTERLTLSVASEEDLMVPEKLRAKSRPPLHGVKHLEVEIRVSFEKHTCVNFVEALLWLAPCLESLSIYKNNGHIPVYKLLKFTYEKPLKGRKKCGCWKTPNIICWRHALEKVSLENRKGDEDDTRLADFFAKGRIDGKMVSFTKNSRSKK